MIGRGDSLTRSEDFEARIRDGLSDELEEELVQTDYALLQELLQADEDPECNGLTQDELIERTGRSRSHISARLSFLEDQDLLEWSISWGKRHYHLKEPQRFDPYQDSPISLELLD